MITEIAHLTIDPARTNAFEAAVAGCAELFRAAPGCRAMRLEREIEHPGRYRLVIGWDTVEDHTVTFRGSDAFARWRAAAGPFFVAAPDVVHTEVVAQPF
ncbi:MAG: antibiotic biosynthesis monooxygenase [Sphingomonas sp.]|nr:MAG: antibiotic biosynthesis monooxygenase [Sphingomonas sp.]